MTVRLSTPSPEPLDHIMLTRNFDTAMLAPIVVARTMVLKVRNDCEINCLSNQSGIIIVAIGNTTILQKFRCRNVIICYSNFIVKVVIVVGCHVCIVTASALLDETTRFIYRWKVLFKSFRSAAVANLYDKYSWSNGTLKSTVATSTEQSSINNTQKNFLANY